MESYNYIDIFETKGIEYLLVILFLTFLIVYEKFLNLPLKVLHPVTERNNRIPVEWFYLAKGAYYHQGHSWAMQEESDVVKIGIDDFAQKLLGKPQAIQFPKIGSRVEQGKIGFSFQIDSKMIPMLSPITGEIIKINEAVSDSPVIVNEDPYLNGWIMKIKTDKMKTEFKNLLTGNLAITWMGNTVHSLRQTMSGNLGLVLQDGGKPVDGFVKFLSPDKWDEYASEFFLTR